MSKVMIFKEKHYDRYFVINDEVDKAKVALKILRERDAEGYWYPSVETSQREKEDAINSVNKKYDQNLIALTDDEVANLPESLRIVAEQERDKYKASLRNVEKSYKMEMEWIESLQQLLNADPDEAIKMSVVSPRGREFNLAIRILDSRADYQYEEYIEEDSEEF